MFETIQANEVKPGDHIYNKYAFHPSAQWVRVDEVIIKKEKMVIKTNVFDVWKYPTEGIAVQRETKNDSNPSNTP
jgi:hypothetical protein